MISFFGVESLSRPPPPCTAFLRAGYGVFPGRRSLNVGDFGYLGQYLEWIRT